MDYWSMVLLTVNLNFLFQPLLLYMEIYFARSSAAYYPQISHLNSLDETYCNTSELCSLTENLEPIYKDIWFQSGSVGTIF